VVWTEELYRIFGLDPTQPPPPYDQHQRLFTAESWRRLSASLTHALAAGGSYELELEIVRTDGSHGWMLARGETVVDRDGNRTGMRGVALDITARREAEHRIREQAELLNQTREAIVVVDPDHRITFWNRGAERMFGWSALEMTGKRIGDLYTLGILGFGSGADAAHESLEFRGEIHGQDRSGKALVIERSVTVLRDEQGTMTGQLNICADITEQKNLEERFLRAQRLESIGMLAAGIAHDLNNVLTPFTMAVPLLRQRTSAPGDIKLLDTLEKCTDRGAGLVRQILGFAHGMSGEPRAVQVKHLLRDVHGVMAETFPKSIVIEEDIPKDLWPVLANPTQLHQVLLNLCVNARDAMPQGGTLRIAGANVVLDQASAATVEGARPGQWLMLEVKDTGTGISPEVMPRIWEPFFTTKSAGKGTGLGLPTVRGIVEAHRGFITLDTAPGRGTTFHVYLPAIESAEAHPVPDTTKAPEAKGHGELILLVDDEVLIRETTKTILTQGGYRVITAADGREGAVIFESNPERFSLVIADRAMPVLDGPGLARLIRTSDPAIKILEITGTEHTMGSSDEQFADAWVHKPFTVEELLQAVQNLLSAGAPAVHH
jgi:two-component system, cell cycle sensor histidine kinase and response regulator CckA